MIAAPLLRERNNERMTLRIYSLLRRHSRFTDRGGVLGLIAVAVLGAVCGGCAVAPSTQESAQAATSFVVKVRLDPEGACALLAPPTRTELEQRGKATCSRALAAEELPDQTTVVSTEVAGHAAQVRLAGQVLFLARFDEGWRIVAAGCQRAGDDSAEPYECAIKGR